MSHADLLKATHFAAEKHSGQKRKDAFGTPYINHPLGVATNILDIGGIDDLTTLQGAVLHDTVEDTAATFEELEKQFGKEVADLVREVRPTRLCACMCFALC
jgi:guanosine-3',5'-bis(diphosphate) 3'-pyrophosphohydrolase